MNKSGNNNDNNNNNNNNNNDNNDIQTTFLRKRSISDLR